MINAEDAVKVASHWDGESVRRKPNRIRWWHSPMIWQHFNRLACGQEIDGSGNGVLALLKSRIGKRVLRDGISVGCGVAHAEMEMLRLNMVEFFHLFELSAERVKEGRLRAENLGLNNRLRFSLEDAFTSVADESMDLVCWFDALHHMMDVDQAVAWSWRVLRPGGVLLLEDFVGPSRFQ